VPDEVVTAGPATLPDGLADRVATFRDRPLVVEELTGGLTNRNYKVTVGDDAYVVRVAGAGSGALAIDRDDEYRNSVVAAESGVGAPVVEYLPDESVLVIGFLEGRTYTDADFQLPGVLDRVADACRRLHGGGRFVNDFDMFEIQAGYLRHVLDHGYRLPDDYLDHADQVARIRAAMAVRAAPTVACNNDLLAGNFIDDGDRIHLIDYEYAGNNDACFELGNIGSECHLDDDQLGYLVDAYFGRHLVHKVARARLHGLMSQYGWTLWASIQDGASDIDFDFWTWGLEKYERAVATFRGSDLDRLIDEVQRAD